MNRPCIITIIGITRGKRVARRKTFNKWPFRISPIFFFFPFLSLSLSLSSARGYPRTKKRKKMAASMFDCSIVRLFDRVSQLFYRVRANGCSSIFVTLPLIFQCFFFFFWIPLRFFFRLVIKCFYKHNNSFFFLLLVISRNRESL